MKTTDLVQSPFEAQMLANIRAKINEWKRDGTTGAGVDCLLQCVKTPSALHGAPHGPTDYAEIFRRLCRQHRDVTTFILENLR